MLKFFDVDSRIKYNKIEEILSTPHVIRVNEFNEEALEKFEQSMDKAHQTKQPVIPIIVDSYGGSVYGLFGMIAAIETAKVPVATILTSKAMSAGAMLFCFGTDGYRFMHPEAQMMIHDAASGSYGKVEEVKASTNQLDYLNQLMYKRVSKHLGHDQDYFAKLIKEKNHADWYLTAKEAKKHHIANHIRIPRFEVKISVDIKFE